MAVRSTQCQNRAVRSTQWGGGVTLYMTIYHLCTGQIVVWRSCAVDPSVSLFVRQHFIVQLFAHARHRTLGRDTDRYEISYIITYSYLTRLGWLQVYIIRYGDGRLDALFHTRKLTETARMRICRGNDCVKLYADIVYLRYQC